MMINKLYANISEKAVRKPTASLSLTEFTKSYLYSVAFRVETNKKGRRRICNLSLAHRIYETLYSAFIIKINKKGCVKNRNLSHYTQLYSVNGFLSTVIFNIF